MSNDKFDLCGYCCKWATENDGKSPLHVMESYPKMMRRVLKERFYMPKKAAREFVKNACYGNWERLHETKIEKASDARLYADEIIWDVWYCSDRWSWDRVLRIQWCYQRLRWRVLERCEA